MADRVVSVRLEARVDEYTASLAKAAAATRELGKSAEASAKQAQAGMDKAGKSSSTLGDQVQKSNEKVESSNKKLGLSAAEAARQVAAIRAELTQLGRSKVGVGVDTVEARTELEKLRAKLEQIDSADPDVRVTAETAAAEAQLRAIQSQLNKIDGQSVRAEVKIDDQGATQRAAANIQTLTATALAASPALIGIGAAAVAGIGAIAPLAASAGAGLGVLVLGFSGVGDAVELVGKRQAAMTADAAKSAASQVSSARQVQSAQASLANAQANAAEGAISAASRVASADKDLARARVDAAEGVARAQERASADVDSALRQQERAQRTLSDAQDDARRSQEDLTYARADARRELEDMNAELRNSSLDEESAAIGVERAQERVNEVLAKGAEASALDRREAENGHKQAIARLEEIRTRNARLADDVRVANAQGVDGADQVVAARERVGDAERAVTDAAKAAADAAVAVDKARVDGAAEVARAQRDGAEKIVDAQAQVADAIRAQSEQQRQSAFAIQQAQAAVQAAMATTATASVSALDQINDKLGDIGPSTLRFAEYVDGTLKPAFKRLQEVAAHGLLPGVQEGIDSLLAQEPRITSFVDTFARSLGGLAGDSLKRLSDPQWQAFFDMLQTQGVPQLEAMWRSGDNLAESFASLLTAFAPLATDMAQGIEDLTADFAAWSANLSESQGFHDFEAYVRENWPKIQEIIGNVADIVGKLIQAGAPIGAELLTGFQALTGVLSTMPVGVVEKLLGLFLAYKTAQSVVGVVTGIADSMLALRNNITGLPEKVSALTGSMGAGKVNEFGVAMGGAATSGGRMSRALGGVTGALGGPWGLALAGASVGVGVISSQMSDASAKTDEWTQALLRGGDATRIHTEYLEQFGNKQPDWLGRAAEALGFAASEDEAKDAARRLWNEMSPLEQAQSKVAEWQDTLNRRMHDGKSSAEDQGIAQDRLNYWLGQTSIMQGELDGATGKTNTTIATQGTVVQNMVDSAAGQLSIYSQLLSDKTTKEQETARATAQANGDTTASWQDHVANVNVSLDEYAAALDADVAKKDAWREDVKKVTERGGAEVGAALLSMGIEGAKIADDMANSTDEDFKRMSDSMINNARNGGAGAAWEIDQAMKIMTLASREGTKLTAAAISEELGIGVADAARIAANYGIKLADGINPVLDSLGKTRIVPGTSIVAGYGHFAEGGYTGDGGKYEPKGVVHGGEFVITKERTAKHLPLLEAIHNGEFDNLPGYANGGKVGLIALGRRLQAMGARVAENPAFPPLDMSGHGKTSLHYTGDAIDVNTRAGTSALEQSELAPMAALARSLGFRTIFMAPGHYNHLHVDDGAVGGSMGSLAGVPTAVVLPTPPSMAPFGVPISTGGEAAMQAAYDAAQGYVDANTIVATEPSPGKPGSNSGIRALGQSIAASMGFGNQFAAIDSIFTRESGWNPNAQNPTSSAYGIPQFLNATWAAYGGKTSDPATQIRDGIKYMVDRYGSPNGAKAFWDRNHWYDQGGIASGVGLMSKATLEPERVLSPRQTTAFETMVAREFSGGAGGSFTSGNVTVNLEGATISGTFDMGSDGLVRMVDGRIDTVLTNVVTGAQRR